MTDYFPPQFEHQEYHCPHCGVYAHQNWFDPFFRHPTGSFQDIDGLRISFCSRCHGYALWVGKRLVFPASSVAPLPSTDLPEDSAKDFNEARAVFTASPRASAALLRLVIQKLCRHLGQSGENINADIAALVRAGLPQRIQQALDVVRVVGNNAVHPGEINLDDKPETALAIFKLINMIVDAMITQPKEVQVLFEQLPEGAKQAIEKRDKTP